MLLALLLLCPEARAQSGTASGPGMDLISAKALGMAGAFRAQGYDDSAIDQNPAGLAQLPKFDLEAGYYKDVDASAQNEYGIEVMLGDSLTGARAGGASRATGLAFEYRKADHLDSQRYIAAAATPLSPGKAWLGLNSKYLNIAYPGCPALGGPLTPAGCPLDSTGFNGFTVGLSTLFRTSQSTALAIGMDNLFNGGSLEAPRNAAAGLAWIPARWISLEADGVVDLQQNNQPTGWSVGAQVLPWHWLALRGGYYLDTPAPRISGQTYLGGAKAWTAGLGLLYTTFTLDYAMRIPDGERRAIQHYFTIALLHF